MNESRLQVDNNKNTAIINELGSSSLKLIANKDFFKSIVSFQCFANNQVRKKKNSDKHTSTKQSLKIPNKTSQTKQKNTKRDQKYANHIQKKSIKLKKDLMNVKKKKSDNLKYDSFQNEFDTLSILKNMDRELENIIQVAYNNFKKVKQNSKKFQQLYKNKNKNCFSRFKYLMKMDFDIDSYPFHFIPVSSKINIWSNKEIQFSLKENNKPPTSFNNISKYILGSNAIGLTQTNNKKKSESTMNYLKYFMSLSRNKQIINTNIIKSKDQEYSKVAKIENTGLIKSWSSVNNVNDTSRLDKSTIHNKKIIEKNVVFIPGSVSKNERQLILTNQSRGSEKNVISDLLNNIWKSIGLYPIEKPNESNISASKQKANGNILTPASIKFNFNNPSTSYNGYAKSENLKTKTKIKLLNIFKEISYEQYIPCYENVDYFRILTSVNQKHNVEINLNMEQFKGGSVKTGSYEPNIDPFSNRAWKTTVLFKELEEILGRINTCYSHLENLKHVEEEIYPSSMINSNYKFNHYYGKGQKVPVPSCSPTILIQTNKFKTP